MKGIEIELMVMLIFQTLGTSIFARFEVETPIWRKLLKWAIIIVGTLALYLLIGHLSLIFPILMAAIGTAFHFIFCHKKGIHPIRATPRKKYYELRGWEWQE